MCEAQQERGFEYMDEQSIDRELKCSICTDPFIDPVVTPSCDHTFCRSGIESALKNKTACPDCRHAPLFLSELKPPSRILTNLLNRILVRCNKCGEINIQRDLFDEHIRKLCPKMEISCPASDIKCEWTGPCDQLSSHLANCLYEKMRPTFSELIRITEDLDQTQRENQQLKLHVNDLTHRCDRYENENQKLKEKIAWIELRYTQAVVKKDQADANTHSGFDSIEGYLVLSDNNCVVRKTGGNWNAACRYTTNFYHGTATLRFALEQLHTPSWLFFGIISMRTLEKEWYHDIKTVYGWEISPLNRVVLDGTARTNFGGYRCNFQQGDIIRCEVDCDRRTFRHTNERTRKTFELDVDISKCALPWQLCFGLFNFNDCIRIL